MSLVEILVGLMVITIVSLATLAYFTYGMAGVNRQGGRRAALERARERMEEALAAGDTQIAPPMSVDNPLRGDAWYWVHCAAGVCNWSAANPNDTVTVGAMGAQPMECLIRWVNDPSVAASPDPEYLELSVKVWFAPGGGDTEWQRVQLRTLRSP